MATIISRPATPTFIVSTPGSADLVRSVHGRIGDVLAQDDDYDITQINPVAASDDDVITVEAGRFVIKSLQISGSPVLTTVPVDGEIIQFNGTEWDINPVKISGKFVLAAAVQAGDVLTFDGENWVNFEILTTVANSIDNKIAAHALVTDGVHGLLDSGGGSLFLADDGSYKAITHPPDVVTSVFGRSSDVIAAFGDYAISDIAGLTTIGTGFSFLADDGTYKAIIHPPAPVASVFGRLGFVVAVNNDYSLSQIDGLIDSGTGTNFLADDGFYKVIIHPPDAIDTVFGRTGDVVAVNNDYTLTQIDGLIDSGAGTDFLADDGTYKTPPAAPPRQVASPSVANATTITQAFQTIFDFAPDTEFRNQNCLITIYYQAMNVGGPATWSLHLRSLIGLTVQQNAYGAGVAQNADGSERVSVAVTMEAIVSATGNIQIQSFAGIRDHDLANSAADGKTRLVLELA